MCYAQVAVAVVSALASASVPILQAQGQAQADKANARAALYEGYSQEAQARREGRSALANQVASLSTRGVSLQNGSPLDLLAETARSNELNQLQIRANAQNQSDVYRAQASAALKQGWYGAAGSLLSQGSKMMQLGNFGGGSPMGGGDGSSAAASAAGASAAGSAASGAAASSAAADAGMGAEIGGLY